MKLKVVYTAMLALVVLNVVLLFQNYRKTNISSGYVDIIRLLDQYQFRKDLMKGVESKMVLAKNRIDSLRLQVNMKAPNTPEWESLRNMCGEAEYKYQNDVAIVDRSVSEKVWNRLNPLIYKFGKERDIKLLVGANGSGNVLYGDSSIDYTAQLVKYVNDKYENK